MLTCPSSWACAFSAKAGRAFARIVADEDRGDQLALLGVAVFHRPAARLLHHLLGHLDCEGAIGRDLRGKRLWPASSAGPSVTSLIQAQFDRRVPPGDEIARSAPVPARCARGSDRAASSRPPAAAHKPALHFGNAEFRARVRDHQNRTRSSVPARPPAHSLQPPRSAAWPGGACTTPPNPRPSTLGVSPRRKPFRSMPEQKVPPAPVMRLAGGRADRPRRPGRSIARGKCLLPQRGSFRVPWLRDGFDGDDEGRRPQLQSKLRVAAASLTVLSLSNL